MSTKQKLIEDLDISISKLSETMTDYGKGKLQAFRDVKFHIQNEFTDNEAELRKENEEMIMMLKSVKMFFDKTPHLTELQKPMVLNRIESLLNIK